MTHLLGSGSHCSQLFGPGGPGDAHHRVCPLQASEGLCQSPSPSEGTGSPASRGERRAHLGEPVLRPLSVPVSVLGAHHGLVQGTASRMRVLGCKTSFDEHEEPLREPGSLPAGPEARAVQEPIPLRRPGLQRLRSDPSQMAPRVASTYTLVGTVVLHFGWVLSQKFSMCVHMCEHCERACVCMCMSICVRMCADV